MNPFRPCPLAIGGHCTLSSSFPSREQRILMNPDESSGPGTIAVGRGSKVAAGRPFSRIYCSGVSTALLFLCYLGPPSGSRVSRLLSERNVLLYANSSMNHVTFPASGSSLFLSRLVSDFRRARPSIKSSRRGTRVQNICIRIYNTHVCMCARARVCMSRLVEISVCVSAD